ncbi:hypothetical protein GPALN_013118 [Globodera pallida]|nr:hypothetical protein GPALN_013118 [Globodera pallida]
MKFYLPLCLFLISGGLCNEPGSNLVKMMEKHILELKALDNEPKEKIIEKIAKLRDNSEQLVELIKINDTLKLQPFIFLHSKKIAQFCTNLMIGEGLDSNVIRKRLQIGIDQITDRVVLIRRLMDTSIINWEEIWSLVSSFELNEGPNDALDKLVIELRHLIDKNLNDICLRNTYYSQQLFENAREQITNLANDGNGGQKEKLDKILKIVPKLLIESILYMLNKVMIDLMDDGKFFGIKFSFGLSKMIFAAEQLCKDLLLKSTLPLAEQNLVNKNVYDLIVHVNKLFEGQKVSVYARLENVGTMLNEMARLKIDFEHCTSIHQKDVAKRQHGIKILQEIQELFINVNNELDMTPSHYYTFEMMKEKLDKLEQFMKLDIVKNGMLNDDVKLFEKILNCLDIGEIKKLIQKEANKLAHVILF